MYERFTLKLGQILAFDLADLKREEGQGVTEYGLVLAFVAVALVGVLTVLSGGIGAFIGKINDAISALPGFK